MLTLIIRVIEPVFGQTIGTNQLLRSLYNEKRALLVVTGPTASTTRLTSTKISTQAAISQFTGDAIVADADNTSYSYRFKKVVAITGRTTAKQFIDKNSHIIIYLVAATTVFGLILLALFLIIRKNMRGREGNNEE